MLLISNIFLLLVNEGTFRREFTILFNRVAIFILLYSGIIGHGTLYVTCLDTGIGIYNGLFHSTVITHSFDLFIYIIAPIILLLTGFYARRIVQPIISYNRFEADPKKGLFSKGYVKAYRNVVMGIDAPQFTTLAYSLIILFILIGAILLMSSSDLISMFLAIELQSYGLYILATLYRNSEWSTSAGLTYFLLGAKRFRRSLVLCLELSNSEDALKLMAPSYLRKIISGWSNYSCKVTSHKMIEKEMGYRGSKPIINNIIVKEQRVDGSRCFNTRHSRYTLMGFVRNYQVKIPSKQILNKRLYSSVVERSLSNQYSLNPWFITGFLDGEGSFMVVVRKNPKNRTGWRKSYKSKDI